MISYWPKKIELNVWRRLRPSDAGMFACIIHGFDSLEDCIAHGVLGRI